MVVLKLVVFCVFAVLNVKCMRFRCRFGGPFNVARTEKTNEPEDKEYRAYSGIRTIPSPETEFFVFDNKLSWAQARDACFSLGMSLASPETSDQILKLKDIFKDNGSDHQYFGYWVGAKRDYSECPFTWQQSGKTVGALRRLPGEPKYFSDGDCVEFRNNTGSLRLDNINCDTLRGYICEKKNDGLLNNKIPDEMEKYKFQDWLDAHKERNLVSSTSGHTGSVSSASDKTYLASSTTDKSVSDSSTTDKTHTFSRKFFLRIG